MHEILDGGCVRVCKTPPKEKRDKPSIKFFSYFAFTVELPRSRLSGYV